MFKHHEGVPLKWIWKISILLILIIFIIFGIIQLVIIRSLSKDINGLKSQCQSLQVNQTISNQDYVVQIKKKDSSTFLVNVKDHDWPDSSFSFETPANLTWGLVSVTRNVITANVQPNVEQKQYVEYTFISEFRPHTHKLSIVIANSKYKNDTGLVTQGTRKYVSENNKYVYLYDVDSLVEQYYLDNYENDVNSAKGDVKNIIKSFKIENN